VPFVSKAQQGYLHAHPEVLGKEKLAEFDSATKGMHNLPEHVENGKPSYSSAHKARKKKEDKPSYADVHKGRKEN
jgi:hypothetical protein